MTIYRNGVAIEPLAATLVVAASDSLNPERADYQCDGVDDHVQIQAALDALPATGGKVLLLDGTYYVESTINLDSFQTLQGCGRNTVITTSTAALPIIAATGSDGSEKVGILLADFCIDGEVGGVATGDPLVWTYVDFSKIINLWIRKCSADAIWLTIGLISCDYNQILSNTLEDNEAEGINLNGSTFNIISGNIVLNTDDLGISIYPNSDNNTIVDNVLRGNSNGITCYGENNTIAGNTCNKNTNSGISLPTPSKSNTVTGNTCVGNGASGISTNDSKSTVIVGNIANENTSHGIHVLNSNGFIVVGNFCKRNGKHGIDIQNSNNSIISGNTCIENGQTTDNTTSNISVQTTCDYNTIANNICRAPTIGTTLSAGEPSGETVIAVVDATGFEVGMGVVFDLGGVNEEYRRITVVAGNVITIDAGLTNTQSSGETIDVPEAQYGINIEHANCNFNTIKNNDLYDSGKTANFRDIGTLTEVGGDNRDIELTQVRKLVRAKNTSGGELVDGDVVVLKAVAAGNEITTTTSQGDDLVYGQVVETIADGASGHVLVKGKTTTLKVDGTADIAIGDPLGTFTTVKIAMKAGAGDQAFAIALEAYATNDSNGVIDAYIKSPWD